MMDEYEERRGFMVGEGNIYTEGKRGQKGFGRGVTMGVVGCRLNGSIVGFVVGTLPPPPSSCLRLCRVVGIRWIDRLFIPSLRALFVAMA
jgi:hypothetical protein